jgi:peroxiredoxin
MLTRRAVGAKPPPRWWRLPAKCRDRDRLRSQLVRYEHVHVALEDPQLSSATNKLEADDQSRQHADFKLADLSQTKWNLHALSGKVVLVNFWATWCPPCRRELPDLEALYQRFRSRGFVILAMSDEDVAKVKPFVAQQKLTYPVPLDPGRKVNELFQVEGIPKALFSTATANSPQRQLTCEPKDSFWSCYSAPGWSDGVSDPVQTSDGGRPLRS